MKKILFLISTLQGGGAERALCNVTLEMDQYARMDILVNCKSDGDYPHKGHVISLGLRHKNTLWGQTRAAVKRILVLRRLKGQRSYDACVSFMDSANMANILSGRKKCKVIISERIHLSECNSRGYKYIVRPAAKRLYARADKVVALSKGVEADLIRNFRVPRDKAVTVYNGFDLLRIKEKARQPVSLRMDGDNFYFLSVGRLCEQKGQWHLIRAFYEVHKRNPRSRLILAGGGSNLRMYKQMVRDYQLEGQVVFTGFVENPFALAARCHVFVMPSLYEGFGNAIVENMACGLPVVACDARSGIREILAPHTDYNIQQASQVEYAEYGVIVPVCSGKKRQTKEPLEWEERLLAQAMASLMEDGQLRAAYRERALKRAEDFSIEHTVKQWLELV